MKTGLGDWWDNFAQESEEIAQRNEKRTGGRKVEEIRGVAETL